MTDRFRDGYDKARALFPILPPYYEFNPVSDDGIGHVRFKGLNSASLPIFVYRSGATITEEEAEHEAGHAYKAILERKYPYRAFGEEYWANRGFPGTYAKAKAELSNKTGMAAWIADPNESWAEAFRIAVSLNAVAPNNEHTLDFGKTINPVAARVFFRSLAPSAEVPVSPTPAKEVTTLIDIRQKLPRADWSIGTFAPKTSVTVHWNGPPVDYAANPVNVAIADANFHISKNWGTAADPAYGDGIMYHRLYAPDGTVFQTRDDDAVLWHCGSAGNATSWAWQVMTGQGQSATSHQLESLKRDLLAVALPRKAHRDWSATTCPGDELYAFVHSDLGASAGPKPPTASLLEEDDMFTEADREMLKRVKDILEAREPLVWAARGQRFLDVESGKAFDPNKAPTDPRIKT